MQGATWGGSDVPVELTDMYGLLHGFTQGENDEWRWTGDAPLQAEAGPDGNYHITLPQTLIKLWRPFNSAFADSESLRGNRYSRNPFFHAVDQFSSLAQSEPWWTTNRNPSNVVNDVKGAECLGAYKGAIYDVDPSSRWPEYLSIVTDAINDDLEYGEDSADELAVTFETEQTPVLQRAQGRMLAQLATQNGLTGDTHFMALAALEQQHINKVADFRAGLRKEDRAQRAQLALTAIGQMAQLYTAYLEHMRLYTATKTTIAQFELAAQHAYWTSDLQLHVQAAKWNIDLLGEAKATNVISGSPTTMPGTPAWAAMASLVTQGLGAATGLVGAAASFL